MKLLLFPLVFLIVFAFLSQLGIGLSSWSASGALEGFSGAANGWYDADDHLVAYPNGTYAGEVGDITFPVQAAAGGAGPWKTIPYWTNASGNFNVYTEAGERMIADSTIISFDLVTSLGMIALIGGGIILACIVGARFLSWGQSEESVSAVWKGTLLLSVWGVFSVLSLSMITGIPFLGPFFYIFLTVLYCMGVINQVGHPGED